MDRLFNLPIFDPDVDDFSLWFQAAKNRLMLLPADTPEKQKAALLVSMLNMTAFGQLCTRLQAKNKELDECSLEDVKNELTAAFEKKKLLFTYRRECWSMQQPAYSSLDDWYKSVMKAVQQFDFKSFSEKELAVLIYAQGLHNPQLKEHLLLKLAARKPDEETDLETVHQEALTKTQVRSEVKSRQDILAVRSQHRRSTPAQEEHSASEDEDYPTRRRSQQRRVPRTPCYGCGEMHYRDDCPFSNKTCPACNKIGHKTGFCNFAKPKKAPLEVNLVSAPASSTMNFTRISVRRAHDAQSAEKTINIKVDTGSEVTIISHRTWSALKKPRLNHAAQAIVTAAKKPLKLLGWFNAQVHWKGTSRTTKLFVSPSNLQILGYPTFEALGMNAKPFKEVCCSAKTDSSKPKTEHPPRSSARTKPRSSASTTTAVAQRPAASRVAQRSTKPHSLGKGTVNVLSLDVQLKPTSVSSSKKPKKTPRSMSGSLSAVRKTAALSRDAAPRQPTSSGPDQSAPALNNAEDKTIEALDRSKMTSSGLIALSPEALAREELFRKRRAEAMRHAKLPEHWDVIRH